MSEQKKPIGVLIADDHPVVRQGLRMMLEMAHGFELVGEATDGGMAVRLTAEPARRSLDGSAYAWHGWPGGDCAYPRQMAAGGDPDSDHL